MDKTMIRKFIITILFISTTLLSFSDNVKFTMSAPNVVSVGEQFRLSFTLNERGTELQLPDMSNFDVLMGPSTSSSFSSQTLNGKITQTSSFSYTFILRAKQEGEFTIRPASIKADGKIYESNELTIQVVNGQAAPNTQQQQQQQSSPKTTLDKDDLFVKVDLDKKNIFKGEQIIATVKIYVAPTVPITSFSDVKLPSYEGFWTQEIEVPSQVSFTREVYDNKIYQVGVLKKTILFPQQTGKIKIDPFEITCMVRQRLKQQRSFFDDFFDNYRTIPAKITSSPVTVNIKELPSTPASFYGAVGNFDFTASIDKSKLKANEAVTLTINISGEGNLRLIEAPKLELPADFEVYDPKTTDKFTASDNGLRGNKHFEYLFIPRFAGDYTIPSIQFAFFNPSIGKYVYKSSPEFNISVLKGDDEQTATVTSAFSKEDVRFIGKDIRYIKQNQYKLKSKESTLFGSTIFYLSYLGSSLIFLLIVLIYRKKLKENANLQLVRNKHANKVARKRLKTASSFLKQQKKEEFYESVLKAFWGYLSDKLSIPVADLNKDNAASSLQKRQVSKELTDELISLLDTCEFARYAPSASGVTMDEVYEKSASLMGKLEKHIR